MSDSSRREFLKVGAGVLAGAAMAGGLNIVGAKKAYAAVPLPWGWPTSGIEVEVARQRGYDSYKGVGMGHAHCGFGAFNGIISLIVEQDPTGPYANIPTGMMEYAASGVAGFASFCGALNGACAAISLVCNASSAKGFISDLLTWYCQTALPTNNIMPTGWLPQSVAGTTLCHTSVTNWCLASGYASGSSERSERCARLTGDVVAKAVEMLNAGVRPNLLTPAKGTVCVQCHYVGTNYAGGQFTRGEENCITCHTDLRKIPSGGHKGSR